MAKKQKEQSLTYEADADFMNDFLNEVIRNMYDSGNFDDFFSNERMELMELELKFKLKQNLRAVKTYLKEYPALRKEQEWKDLVNWLENRIVVNK